MPDALRWPALFVAAMVLAACGGGDDGGVEGDFVAGPADDMEFDSDDLDDMAEQIEQLGQQAREEFEQALEDFEPEPLQQDPDRPLLLPADVTITGDLAGTYTANPGCDLVVGYSDPDGGYHEEGVLVVRFGYAGHSIDWTTELPDDPRPLDATLAVPNFTGGGSYDGFVTLRGVEPWADGTADVTIEEIWVAELPLADHLVIGGSFAGTYRGAVGSGGIAGDLGVCNFPWP